MKVKILKSVIANVNGNSVAFGMGQVVDVPNEAAEHLINGGYAEKIQKPKPETTTRTKRSKQEK